MPPRNKRLKQIHKMALNKRIRTNCTDLNLDAQQSVENASTLFSGETISLAQAAEEITLHPSDGASQELNEDVQEWNDIFDESESDEEWEEDVGENQWKELIAKMQLSDFKNQSHLRSAYTGSSRATFYRKKSRAKALENEAKQCQRIYSYFQLSILSGYSARTETETSLNDTLETMEESQSDDDSYNSDSEENELEEEKTIIDEIQTYLANKKGKKSIGPEETAKLQAVLQFLRIRQTGAKKGQASSQIAIANGKSTYWGRCIVGWAKQWKENHKILLSRRGKHPKTKNLLTDNDIYLRLSSWIRTHHKFDISPKILQKHVNEVILPSIGVTNDKKCISERTANRWLKALGWIRSATKKGIYIDGHERADVVDYRQKFLQTMKEFEERMIMTHETNPDILKFPPNGVRPLVFYTHDETIFYANDGQRVIWHPRGEMPLRKKGRGRSIMVSEFLSIIDGRLKHTRPAGSLIEAREIIHPGKNNDGYWGGEDVAKQFRKAIAIHKEKYPDYDALWAFDNSSNHNCYAQDALVVSKMNLGSGGCQARLRDTVFNGVTQTMIFPDDYPDESLRGKPKGMKRVLEERGLWSDKLLKICEKCKSKVEVTDRRTCCAKRILELQDDFRLQKSLLEEIAEQEGQHIIFYPKFHPEFNYIEMYWGAAKRFTRENCDYTFHGLQATVPLALDYLCIDTLRRFASKAFRYMDAYRKGLTGEDAERQVKRYASHRRIPLDWSTNL